MNLPLLKAKSIRNSIVNPCGGKIFGQNCKDMLKKSLRKQYFNSPIVNRQSLHESQNSTHKSKHLFSLSLSHQNSKLDVDKQKVMNSTVRRTLSQVKRRTYPSDIALVSIPIHLKP